MCHRVGLVIGHLTSGGAERQLFEVARALDSNRYPPFVYCLSEKSEPYGTFLREAGIPLRVFPRKRSFDPGRVWALARKFREDHIEIVDCFLRDANAYGFGAWKLSRARAMIASVRLCAPHGGKIRHFLDGLILRKSSKILGNSGSVREYIIQTFGVPSERVVAIHNGVNLERFTWKTTWEENRIALGFTPQDRVVFTAGRLSPQKNIPLFLDTAARVLKTLPNTIFAIAGEGPLRGELEGMTADLGIGERVRFLGFRKDIPELLRAADLFVLASDFEGFPNAVLEAMAAGTAAVVTDLSGCGELITPGKEGLIVPARNPEALASAILSILEFPERIREIGNNGAERIRRDFSIETVVARRMDLYDTLIS